MFKTRWITAALLAGKRPCLLNAVMVLLLCWRGASGVAAEGPAAVAEGETAAQVVEKLGKPQGHIEQDRRMVYLYDRGLVYLVDGRVVRADLVTPPEAARLKRERARTAEEYRRQAEAERSRLMKEGAAELAKRLSDGDFAKRPPAERLAYWQDFGKRYPETDVTAPLAQAETDVAAERKDKERAQDVTKLTQRLREIKDRFRELDAEYTASLANWKRNEIDAERTKLTKEMDDDQARIRDLLGVSAPTVESSSAPASEPPNAKGPDNTRT